MVFNQPIGNNRTTSNLQPNNTLQVSQQRDYVLLGLSVSSRCRMVGAVALGFHGSGLSAHCEVLDSFSLDLPPHVQNLYAQLASSKLDAPGVSALLSQELAQYEGQAIFQLISQLGNIAPQAITLGVLDPGLWHLVGADRCYASLCDSARLAELTGLNVIDGFAARDLAQSGLGGPLTAIPNWMLLRHETKARVLIDLGRTVQLTYLPPGDQRAVNNILAFDVSPGTALLDILAQRLTEGQREFDPGGTLAVQGKKISELIEYWLEDDYFKKEIPRWHPLGCRHEVELQKTVQMAIDSGWSIRDLLCTSCHFIADITSREIENRLPKIPKIEQIILAGGGQQNGMLLREIAARNPEIEILRMMDSTTRKYNLDMTAAATLAYLHVQQIPANQMAISGVDIPRVLGRLTPGSPQNWHKLLTQMSSNRPTSMSLRSAM